MVNDFRALFQWLDQSHRPLVVDKLNSDHKSIYDELIINFPPISDSALDSQLPSDKQPACDLVGGRQCLYLSPNPLGEKRLPFLPFLSLECDFDRTVVSVRIYLAMAMRTLKGIESQRTIRILGFRYDSPEGTGEGLHDLFHVQMIHSFRRGASALNSADADLDWIPTAQPSFPVDACCPVTLALSILVTLYGMRYLEDIYLSERIPKHYFETMHCWKSRPRFWRVLSKRGEHYLGTRILDESTLKLLLCAELKVSSVTLEPCNASQYSAVPGDQKIQLSEP